MRTSKGTQLYQTIFRNVLAELNIATSSHFMVQQFTFKFCIQMVWHLLHNRITHVALVCAHFHVDAFKSTPTYRKLSL